MKNFIKLFGSMALLVMFCLTLSSYDSVQPVDDPGNATVVEVIKGQMWTLLSCGPNVTTTKTTTQIKDGVVHVRTLIFQLPEGHCLIQKKAYKIGDNFLINPSGKVIYKVVNNN